DYHWLEGQILGSRQDTQQFLIIIVSTYKRPHGHCVLEKDAVLSVVACCLPGCWNGSPELVSAALVDPQRGGQTTLSASQVAAGSKRLRTVEFGTPYKRPMSSSGRLSFYMIDDDDGITTNNVNNIR
ncbi:jg16807, partial [Pararge aegeria aegeria]